MCPATLQEAKTKTPAKASKKIANSPLIEEKKNIKPPKTKASASKKKEASKLNKAEQSKAKTKALTTKSKKSISKAKSSKSDASKTKNASVANKNLTKDKGLTLSIKDTPQKIQSKISSLQEDNISGEPIDLLDNKIIPDNESKIDDNLLSSNSMSEEEIRAKALASIKIGPKGVYTEDSIRVYLQEIGRIRLLRPDEEIELARKIADLLHLEEEAIQFESENGHYPTTKEWAAMQGMPLVKFRRRLMLGRRAKEKMVQSNLRLVVSIAKKYMNRGLSFQDLIQEGSLGLIRAAEKFDHEKGYKFSTYATWWIRQAITRAIADQSRTIRLPVHLYETISRIKKTTKVLSQEFGRKPTEEEIAESMEMTIEKLRFIAKSAQLPISLETPIGKEEDSRLGDFIEADIENPEQDVAKNLLREDLEGVLATLSPRERDVLRLRYGLDDGRMKTLEEIGQIFDVTRERIRQIEAKALRKLRHPNRNGVLKEYIK